MEYSDSIRIKGSTDFLMKEDLSDTFISSIDCTSSTGDFCQGFATNRKTPPSSLHFHAFSSSSDSSTSDSDLTPSSSQRCPLCPMTFESSYDWTEHLQTQHSCETISPCPSCGCVLYGRDFEMHLRTCRADDDINADVLTEVCSSAEVSDYEMCDVSKSRSYDCSTCHSQFASYSLLCTHIRRKHLNSECVKCEVCGKSLSSNSALKKHKTLHTGETPFSCDFCDGAFRQKVELEKHLDSNHANKELAHIGKTFLCSVCDKAFLFQSSLTTHMRYHKQKTHTCHFCGACFNLANDLNRHFLARHVELSDRPFVCSICDQRFARKEHLQHHMGAHSDALRHCCPLCSSSFISSTNLRQHMGQKHASLNEDPVLRRSLIRKVEEPSTAPPDLTLLESVLRGRCASGLDDELVELFK